MTYHSVAPHLLLQRLFKRFSLSTALKTGMPTAWYYLRRPALPASHKPALFTMNILPPMMTVWYHCARKYLGDSVDITIFDCSGELKAKEFPKANVQKFVNLYAATKSDEFLRSISQNRKIGWLCDDDIFLLNTDAANRVMRELAVPDTASFSFRPRKWWEIVIDGQHYQPSGSYCIAFNREIFVEKEKLSLRPANGNTHPAVLASKQPSRYDTGDLSNEILLKKGYRCAILPEREENDYIAGFSGLSGTVMLLRHFRNTQETFRFFDNATPKQWSSNVIYGTFAALLAIRTIQDCYTLITGKPYALPSLPDTQQIQELRSRHEKDIGPHRSFDWVDQASAKLKAAL